MKNLLGWLLLLAVVSINAESNVQGRVESLAVETSTGATAESSTAESSTAESSTAESSTAESSTAESSTAESSTTESSTTESSTAESSTTESSTTESSTAESSTTAAPPATIVKPYIVVIYKVEMLATETTTTSSETTTHNHGGVEGRGMPGHTFTPVCTGALIAEMAVLTTASCALMAKSTSGMPVQVSTARYSSSADNSVREYFEVNDVVNHPQFDSPAGAFNDNLAVLRLKTAVPLSNKVALVALATSGPQIGSACATSFWQTAVPFTQKTSYLTTGACADEFDAAFICAGPGAAAQHCVAGSEGTVMTFNAQVVAILSNALTGDCQVTSLPFYDVTKQRDWINAAVNAASLTSQLSVGVLLLAIAARWINDIA